MRQGEIKTTMILSIPMGQPDRNGTIYTQEAIKNAVKNIPLDLPIIYRDNDKVTDGVLIGNTNSSPIAEYDSENEVCKLTIDGTILFGGLECIVNGTQHGQVTDFEIVGVGLSK